jgi:hypothetical protein
LNGIGIGLFLRPVVLLLFGKELLEIVTIEQESSPHFSSHDSVAMSNRVAGEIATSTAITREPIRISARPLNSTQSMPRRKTGVETHGETLAGKATPRPITPRPFS